MIIEKILSDGIVVGRRGLALNINKNRRYYIAVDGHKYCDNLLYSEILHWLPIVRQAMNNSSAIIVNVKQRAISPIK